MDNDSSTRIVDGLLALIETAGPGARLPSTRVLVAEYGASPVTVQKALRTLATRGLIESRPGAGTFVRATRLARPVDYGWQTGALRTPPARVSAATSAMRDATNDRIALHAGYPTRELLPERLVRAALARASRSDAAFTRSPVAGLPELQAWFAAEVAASTPAGVTPPMPGDVTILPGTQSGLGSVFRALVGPGRPLLVESPTYWGAITAAAQAGVDVVPIPSGASGPDPDEVDRAFVETGARAMYVQPTFANPTGAQWSPQVAARMLEVAQRHSAFLIEDDWAHDFGIEADPAPLARLDTGGHVVYFRSLTKSVAPAIRVGAVIARGPARDRIRNDRAADAMYVSGVLQAAALDVVTHPGFQTHLRGLRQQLGARRDLLASSLRQHAPMAHIDGIPRGGLNLWIRLTDGVDVPRLVASCEADGLLIGAGHEWYPAEPEGPRIRLNYSGPNPGAFADGARILGSHLR
ncbi:aminotransferase-like domain-containing protein [Marisediminicola senii]|uniref:aminotransferase-like domain-containing protein n=1 Tax=Marisediminicola senii TaxID=2711233 RepID=UPI0013EB9B5A|nr:PLP-dependent aminotransferase family protein [Marisediminicola senii]